MISRVALLGFPTRFLLGDDCSSYVGESLVVTFSNGREGKRKILWACLSNVWVDDTAFVFPLNMLLGMDKDLLATNRVRWQQVMVTLVLVLVLVSCETYMISFRLTFGLRVLRLRLAAKRVSAFVCLFVCFFFFFFQPLRLTFSIMNSIFMHCLWIHKYHFLLTFLFLSTFSLKMGTMILFTHLKIILLQYFSVLVFSFQLYPNGDTW